MTDEELKEQLSEPSSNYIRAVLERYCLNGDAFISEEKLYSLCKQQHEDLSYSVFTRDLREQYAIHSLHREGSRIYLDKIWRCEECTAQSLAELLHRTPLPQAVLRPPVRIDGFELTEEQCAAVSMALNNRISIILGCAGSGKSTLIKAIVNRHATRFYVVCAPTGKAARNITARTGIEARTVHSACGLMPDEDFLPPVQWVLTSLVIVDEASMLTLELLTHLLARAPADCRIVLIGDPNQLPSVGAGNVIPDLLKLNVPSVLLTQNHRQAEDATALRCNVVRFKDLTSHSDLMLDESFQIHDVEDDALQETLVRTAAEAYLSGTSFQLITPYRKSTDYSCQALNPMIRNILNPYSEKQLAITDGIRTFHSGDRVMILNNDRERNCNNGDIGILQVISIETVKKQVWNKLLDENIWIDVDKFSFFILLPDGRCPFWHGIQAKEAVSMLDLAYAITVHKAQGSQYDTVLMPVSMQMQNMLNRNLFYTAISRATKKVLLFGSLQAVDIAVRRSLPQRRSVLVSKVQMQSMDNI